MSEGPIYSSQQTHSLLFKHRTIRGVKGKNGCVFWDHLHYHVHEGLGVFPLPWSPKWNWSLHLFLGRPMFLRPFGSYCNACYGILFVSILCTCCSHFSWYCFISFTIFCAPVFSLIYWFFSLSNFVIPSKCLKIFICAASERCSSFLQYPGFTSKFQCCFSCNVVNSYLCFFVHLFSKMSPYCSVYFVVSLQFIF